MISLDELLNRYRAGERDFSQIQIYSGELVNRDLSNIDLSGASLRQVSLVDCDLSRANLSNTNITNSYLEGINLNDANLSHANFCVGSEQDYSQIRANILSDWTRMLDNLPLEAANKAREQMSAQMSQQLEEVLMPVSLRQANLERADLSHADLRKAYLNDANLQGANLTNANLSEADLRGANLTNANLTGVKCDRTNFSQANLTEATIDSVSFSTTKLNWTIMPDGSVHSNPALELINTKLNPLKRKAWFPVTVRQDGDLTTSKFAGKPWLSADESFPKCDCCNNLMRFFFQLNLEQIPNNIKGEFGEGLLQFFYCVDCDDYQPFSESHLVRIIEPEGKAKEYKLPHFQDNWSNDSLVGNSGGQFPARIIVNWQEITDYPDWQDAEMLGASMNEDELKFLLSVSSETESELNNFDNPNIYNPEDREWYLLMQRCGIVHTAIHESGILPSGRDKLAGYPRWVQDPEYPNCPVCDRSMDKLIVEFASDDNIPYLWGDVGTGYFLQCPKHKKQVAFLWQCG